ncbi:TRAP transporter substrate-binding protein [Pikeienuella piscinae]|uniref:TRAP transporter substrate-binding protein n=1 Tax=Pikeienuella piscinae TaxID=2748098 RepID=A0A7L5BW30_9RHOB|nr:TRAP transporter substrate-binding protein [Pikeienuella piscinae]QIE55048.1 TRAP transporter substrate-binding protein [Pikeienuella piscinae]
MTTRMILTAAALLAGLSCATSAQDKITLQLGTAAQPSWSLGKVINEVLKPKIEEYSDGRIDVVVHGGGSLCSEQACVEQVGLGQIDIASVSSGNVGAFGTTFDIINLPFLFRDQDAASAMLNGWLAEELSTRATADMGMHMLALIPVGGFRNVVNTEREVRVPADLNGLKIRVTKSPTEFNLVKAWGAAPIPYDWSSLYEGLQSGVVQGMYLQDPFTAAGKFYEVVSNITEVGAAWSAHPILMSQARYDALPDWARAAIDKAGADVQAAAFDYDLAWQTSAVTAMEGKVAVYQPTEAEMDLWREGAREAWVAVKGAYDPELARRILSEQQLDKLIADLEAAGAL